MRDKIVTKDLFKTSIRPEVKRDGKTIALCHGVFDLVHPGHITHLKQAREMADVLVVSITSAKFVRKGPGRPYFNDEQRASFLAAIECVDYVMISEGYTVDDIVEAVEPDLYIKGSEYADESKDLTGKIRAERELVERHGGRIAYTGGDVFSSTKLINTALSGLSPEVIDFMRGFKERHSIDEMSETAERASALKVLVVGDVIIDRYTYCTVQGLISKDMAYSARFKSSEDYLGGSLAIARHLAAFTPNVDIMSIIGDEADIRARIEAGLAGRARAVLHTSSSIPTIIKQRFIVQNTKREEYKKVFAINNILDRNYEQPAIDAFVAELDGAISSYDAVFLCDFGHGLIGSDIMRIAQQKARFLALNCQTNSTNKGKNIITKYARADAFTLDQAELQLAYPSASQDERAALAKLRAKLGGVGWLTRGSLGAYAVTSKGDILECPAFTLNVRDTIGAGDAFYAAACLFAAAGASEEMAMAVGNIAGALGANIIGNKDSIEKANVLKYASTLMNV